MEKHVQMESYIEIMEKCIEAQAKLLDQYSALCDLLEEKTTLEGERMEGWRELSRLLATLTIVAADDPEAIPDDLYDLLLSFTGEDAEDDFYDEDLD